MLHPVCQPKMPYQCEQLKVGNAYHLPPRKRQKVEFTPELREEVRTMLAQMHELYRRGSTPKVKPTKACNACSLKEICLPALMRKKTVADYLRRAMSSEAEEGKP